MKPFADKKRCSPLAGALARLGLNPIRRLAVLAAVAVIVSSTFALAQAGSLDPTFGTGGIFTTNYTQYDAAMDTAVAIQSDGKIVLGGTVPNSQGQAAALLRLNTNGTLDSSFGTGGIVTSDFGITDGAFVYAITIQPNGQIVAAAGGGILSEGSVGRFNTDGSVDTTFGSGGFAVSESLFSQEGFLNNALALQADGKILVTSAGLIGRYTSSGQLDTTFGNAGIAPLSGASATAIALQSDGKILVTTGTGAPTALPTEQNLPGQQAGTITRYNTDGSLDTNFGVSGQSACVASAAAMAIQSNGKIVVAGTIPSALLTTTSGGRIVINNQTGFGVVRYNSNGSVDTTFNPGGGIGSGGGIITGFGSSFPAGSAFALAIQSNGEIVVAGQAGVGNQHFTSSSFVLARYTTNGLLDTSFGNNGTVITTLSQAPISFVSALVLQSDGKIVAAGNTSSDVGEGFVLDNFAVARYLAQ
ncbi:MAG: hypothetical protein ABSD98_01360 [Candidatus Korobacteraceae bacterium]|jgi:uncharacterized delta-60 repeat protein